MENYKMVGSFNRAFALAGAVLIAPLPSQAADIGGGGYKDGAAPVVTGWDGFYAGVNIGGGYSPDQVLAYEPTADVGVTPTGVIGGGQIGYNWQLPASFTPLLGYGSLVYGLETDIEASGMSDKGTDQTAKSELDYLGTFRGRVGYATDKTLYYVTGGLAYGGLKQSAIEFGNSYSFSSTVIGYVIGGGFELKTSQAWSLK